ncbi:hypothetical protein RJT34_12103 [Clitoria ternatea]|uniref:Uncharacterized protein n=1 Tax=Clitoria ternatea TaxID=43366 RepID=A0AAN9JL92_CLITE
MASTKEVIGCCGRQVEFGVGLVRSLSVEGFRPSGDSRSVTGVGDQRHHGRWVSRRSVRSWSGEVGVRCVGISGILIGGSRVDVGRRDRASWVTEAGRSRGAR